MLKTKFLFTVLFLSLFTLSVEAQVGRDPMDTPYSYNQRNKAKTVVLNYLRLNGDGFINFCRDDFAPMGCQSRVNALVDIMFSAAQRHNIDPWIVLGLAIEETNFNPFNVSQSVATGILGISYSSEYRLQNMFFRDSNFRLGCRAEADACQREIIQESVRILSEAIETCGSEHGGLQRYRGGTCSSEPRFARHVLRHARVFRNQAERVPDVDVCQVQPVFCNDPLGELVFELE